MKNKYLESILTQFEYYKSLGEKTIHQIPPNKLNWQYNAQTNSVATIVKHLSGNMLSRWTDFLIADGEKEWRNRDAEFENDLETAEDLWDKWNVGWNCLFTALKTLSTDDLDKEIFIRNIGQTVTEAINRQLAHYVSHIGQIILLGKMICAEKWSPLTIPIGDSQKFNAEKFSMPKHTGDFSQEFLQQKD